MGKDKVKPPAANAAPAEPAVAPGTRPPKGHKQRGAGTVITAKPAVVTNDGIVLKAHERLPFQLLQEYCQREKRPNAKYYPNPPGRKFKVVLPDGKNEKNDMTFATAQTFETDSVAKDFAALLALFHLQKSLPLERRLPEPYSTSWTTMINADKEQAKADAKPGRGGASAASAAKTGASTTNTIPASAAASKPGADPVSDDSKVSTPNNSVATTSTTHANANATNSKMNNKSSTTMSVSLNRETADWLCDNCGHQNFACLASGLPRVKCFRCQTAKSATCQLVASSTAVATENSNNAKTTNKPAIAAVNLLAGKNTSSNFATRAEEERAVQEKRAVQKRKQYFFDALRRANRPHIVHIPTALRVKLEALLGMASSISGSSSSAGDEIQLEEVLQTYQESGLFPPDLCNVSLVEQHQVLVRVSQQLIAQSFQSTHVANSVHEVLLQSADDLLDDAIETLETAGEAENTTKLIVLFEKSLSEACLKHLCMNLEESHLPDAYNPKFFEKSKKLSVFGKAAAEDASANEKMESSATEVGSKHDTVSDSVESELDLVIASNPALLSLWNDLCTHCSCNTNVSSNAAGNNAINRVDIAKAVLSAVALTSATSTGSDDYNVDRLYLLSLLLLHHAETNVNNDGTLSAEIETLRAALQPDYSSAGDFDVLMEEIESLDAIFENNFHSKYISDSVLSYYDISIAVSLEQLNVRAKFTLGKLSSLTLKIVVPSLCAYPTQVPLVYLYSGDSAISGNSSFILSELQSALRSKANEFVGEMMIYQVYSYLQECIDQHTGSSTSSSNSSGNSAPIGGVSRRLELFSAYLSSNDSRYQELISLTSAASSAERSANGASDKAASVKTVATVQEIDDDTVTTQATYTTTSTANSNNATNRNNNTAGNKSNKGRSVHSFWTVSTNNAVVKASTSSEKMMQSRRLLPSYAMREEIINVVQNNRAIVLTGETGCGKTTQVPQFLYEHNNKEKILICQPRRLAAVGVATRVAEEVGCALGQEVGYMVKGDSQTSATTRIAFCTYGVLLRRLQDDPTLDAISTVILDEVHERGMDSDFTLALLMFAMSERKDLKLILMSATIQTDHFASYLSKWLNTPTTVPVLFIPGFTFPVVEFYKGDYEGQVRAFRDFVAGAGRRSDYDDYEDENTSNSSNSADYTIGGYQRKGDIDFDLLAKLVMVLARGPDCVSQNDAIVRESKQGAVAAAPKSVIVHKDLFAPAHGSILIFMPGVPEINKLARLLQQHYKHDASGAPRLKILPLHGNLSPNEQKVVFHDAGHNEIKIVISTNVAEASVTIPDVSVVIDTCKVKEIQFDTEIQTSVLTTKFAALDSLRQRRGRAGRVQKGRCFRLITRGTHDKLPQHSVPEILRVPLEKIVLQVKAMLGAKKLLAEKKGPTKSTKATKSAQAGSVSPLDAMDTMLLLSRCPDVPAASSVASAEKLLIQIQALSPTTSALTPLGVHLSTLPCMPRIGRLAVYGALLGCAYSATVVGACMSVRSPFNPSQDSEVVRAVNRAKDQFSGGSVLRSDYTVLVNLVNEFDNVKNKRAFCKTYGLSFERMTEIKESQRDLLTGLVDIGLLRSVQEGLNMTGHANRNASKSRLVAATLCAGLYPQLGKILRPTKRFVEVMGNAVERDSQAKELKFYIPQMSLLSGTDATGAAASTTNASATSSGTVGAKIPDKRNIDISVDDKHRVFLHPSSVNFDNSVFKESNFLMYGERQLVTYTNNNTGNQESKIYLRDTTEASAFALLFFGGVLEVEYSDGIVTVDGWIRFTAPGRIVAIIQEMRKAFDQILQSKFEDPSLDISTAPVVELTCQLLDLNAQY
uniref:RNA helicase n=1 Tax=Spumella elongata TaxID=89044 RepID=A0A7S3M923_9STRA|mmetsp:Transcript_4391/g.7337  ORF Transcript_4391/g.7337 Transcript_4391/m.7337 type:complete len:1822 (+) Transcript_4391:16-5481(+)